MPELSGIIQNYLEGSISTIGRTPIIQSKSITENGTYTAPEGVDGYSPVTVNVPIPTPVIESKSITENGTYTAPEGVDGYSPVTVNVPIPTPVIESKSITENGTYTAPEGVDGYSPVTVNVPGSPIYFEPLTPSSMSVYSESSMSYTEDIATNKTTFTWDGGGSIGCSWNGVYNLRGFSEIIIDVDEIGTSYGDGAVDRFNFIVGLTSEIFNELVLLDYNTEGKLVDYTIAPYSEYYGEPFHDTITIPANTDCYLFVSSHGTNAQGVKIEIR